MRAGLDHRQVDALVGGVELDERRGEHAGDEARRGTDGEMPPGHPRERPRLGPRGLDVGQDPLHEREQGTAIGGEGDPYLTRAPVEEDHTELVLEQANLAGQRGLRQVEAVGGPGEALLLRHGQGVGQLLQLHASELTALNLMLFMSLTCTTAHRMVTACGGGNCTVAGVVWNDLPA